MLHLLCTAGHCLSLPPSLPELSGLCRECSINGQAKAMLAITVILFIVLVVALFAKTWHFGGRGPGIMTKVKIFLTHFQVRCGFCCCVCVHCRC